MSTIKESLTALMDIDGAMGAAIVDFESGMVLGSEGGGVDLEMAGAGNSRVVKAKLETMKTLGIDGDIEDILITLQDQFHIIRPTQSHTNLFIYLVLNREKSNLALARRKTENVEKGLEV